MRIWTLLLVLTVVIALCDFGEAIRLRRGRSRSRGRGSSRSRGRPSWIFPGRGSRRWRRQRLDFVKTLTDYNGTVQWFELGDRNSTCDESASAADINELGPGDVDISQGGGRGGRRGRRRWNWKNSFCNFGRELANRACNGTSNGAAVCLCSRVDLPGLNFTSAAVKNCGTCQMQMRPDNMRSVKKQKRKVERAISRAIREERERRRREEEEDDEEEEED